MKSSIEVNARQVFSGLDFYVKNLPALLDEGVSRAAFETGREEAKLAPKAFSTLVSSIKPEQVALMHWRVGPHVDYAESVEYGSDGGGFVPFSVLFSWVKVKGLQPRNPEWDQIDLTMAIQRSILMRGAAPQPFVQPVVDSGFVEDVLTRQINQKAAQAKREAGL